MPHSPRAVLLVRVSDPKQEREGLSLDNQQQVLRSYASDRGFDVAKEFRFQESADFKIRKRFHEMVQFVKSRKDVGCIIAYRVDRMTRNFHDHVLLDDLRLQHEKEFHFVHDRLVITPQTVGKDIQDWDTKVFLAKMYLNRLKEDATVSAAFKVSRGEWPGKAPFGYRNTRVDNRSVIVPDPGAAPIVNLIFDLYSTGAYSMEQVSREVEFKTGHKVSISKIDYVLKNPFYYGEMCFRGKHYPHHYQPLISERVFLKAQAVKVSFHKKTYKFAGLPFVYRGLIECATCGCRVSPEKKTKPSGRSYVYYHCTQFFGRHGAAYITEADLTAQIKGMLAKLEIPREQLLVLIRSLQELEQARNSGEVAARSRLEAEISKSQKRLDVLYEDRLDGLISKESYLEKREAVEARRRSLERQLRSISKESDEYIPTVTEALRLCSRAPEIFEVATMEEKRSMMKLLFQNCRLDGKNLLWELKKPFDEVFNFYGHPRWLPLADMFINREVELDVQREAVQALLALTHRSLEETTA